MGMNGGKRNYALLLGMNTLSINDYISMLIISLMMVGINPVAFIIHLVVDLRNTVKTDAQFLADIGICSLINLSGMIDKFISGSIAQIWINDGIYCFGAESAIRIDFLLNPFGVIASATGETVRLRHEAAFMLALYSMNQFCSTGQITRHENGCYLGFFITPNIKNRIGVFIEFVRVCNRMI